MCITFERLVAFRYLRSRRREGFISLIAGFSLMGIALGVATLIVVLAVMHGVREELIKSIVGLEGHVTIQSGPRGMEDYDNFVQQLKKMQGVKTAVPIVHGQVMASYKGAAMGAMVTALRLDDLKASKPLLLEKTTPQAAEAFARGEGILVGSRLADRLGVSVGDALMLISPEGRATVAGMVPRVKSYPVVGTFKIGMFAYDNGLVVLPFEEAQLFFKLREGERNAASAIEVMSIDPDRAGELARELARSLPSEFRLYDWKSSNAHIFRAVLVQRNVMFLVLMLIIVVASFNIISGLIMLVKDKSRDIAILRTMGASRGMVMRIFILCGASIGVIGTLLGVALGLLISFNTLAIQHWFESFTGHPLFADELYFLSSLPAKVDFSEVGAVAALSLALSFLATLYPARRAAKLDPAEALRYE